SIRSPVMGTQMRPEVCLRKNAIASGVAASAAMMRSPSFSRSSSSTTTTISPRPIASMAFSTVANGILALVLSVPGGEEPLDVLGHHVDLEVDAVAGLPGPQRRDGRGVRDDRHREAVVERLDHGQAAAVDRDRSLLDDVAQHVLRHPDAQIGCGADDLADAVDRALHEVAAQPVGQPDRPFEVDTVARLEIAEIAASQWLVDDVDRVPAGADVDHGEAHAVVGDRVADLHVLEDDAGFDHEPR